MLVITRRCGESFYIGDNVVVTVLDTSGKRARIGVVAPREVAISRSEIATSTGSPVEPHRCSRVVLLDGAATSR